MWKFIGVSGLIGAGKTTLCDILVERGYIYLGFGKLIEGLVKEEKIKYSRKELQDKGEELIKTIGYSGIVDLLFKRNRVNKTSNYVIDGIRHLDVYNYLEYILGGSFSLIFVEAPLHVRLERIKGRSVKDAEIITLEDMNIIENRDIEKGVIGLRTYADLIIKNVRDKKYLERVVDDFIGSPE